MIAIGTTFNNLAQWLITLFRNLAGVRRAPILYLRPPKNAFVASENSLLTVGTTLLDPSGIVKWYEIPFSTKEAH